MVFGVATRKRRVEPRALPPRNLSTPPGGVKAVVQTGLAGKAARLKTSGRAPQRTGARRLLTSFSAKGGTSRNDRRAKTPMSGWDAWRRLI